LCNAAAIAAKFFKDLARRSIADSGTGGGELSSITRLIEVDVAPFATFIVSGGPGAARLGTDEGAELLDADAGVAALVATTGRTAATSGSGSRFRERLRSWASVSDPPPLPPQPDTAVSKLSKNTVKISRAIAQSHIAGSAAARDAGPFATHKMHAALSEIGVKIGLTQDEEFCADLLVTYAELRPDKTAAPKRRQR